jgi:hypothetical protein
MNKSNKNKTSNAQSSTQQLKQALSQVTSSLAKTNRALSRNNNNSNNNNNRRKKNRNKNRNQNQPQLDYNNFLTQNSGLPKGNFNPMQNNTIPFKPQVSARKDLNNTFALTEWERLEIARYAQAMADPFSIKQTDLPHMPLLSHQSIRNYASGTFYTNDTGFGSITVHPDYCVSNDQTFAVTASSATSPSSVVSAGTSPALQFQMNGPYDQATYQLGTEYGLQYRIVSLGIRIRYQGPVVEAAGTCYTIEMEPKASTDANPFAGFLISDIKAAPTWKEYSVMNGSWHAVTRHILSNKDFDYKGWNSVNGNMQYAELFSTTTDSLDQCSNIAIAIQGFGSQPFEFEVVCHFEVVGDGLPTRTVTSDQSKYVQKLSSNMRKVQAADNTTPSHSVDGVEEVKVANSTDWLDTSKITPLLETGVDLLSLVFG